MNSNSPPRVRAPAAQSKTALERLSGEDCGELPATASEDSITSLSEMAPSQLRAQSRMGRTPGALSQAIGVIPSSESQGYSSESLEAMVLRFERALAGRPVEAWSWRPEAVANGGQPGESAQEESAVDSRSPPDASMNPLLLSMMQATLGVVAAFMPRPVHPQIRSQAAGQGAVPSIPAPTSPPGDLANSDPWGRMANAPEGWSGDAHAAAVQDDPEATGPNSAASMAPAPSNDWQVSGQSPSESLAGRKDSPGAKGFMRESGERLPGAREAKIAAEGPLDEGPEALSRQPPETAVPQPPVQLGALQVTEEGRSSTSASRNASEVWRQVQAVADRMAAGVGSAGAQQIRMDIDPRILPGVQAVMQVLAGQIQLEFICTNEKSRRLLRSVAQRELGEVAGRLKRPVQVTLRGVDADWADASAGEDVEYLHAGN